MLIRASSEIKEGVFLLTCGTSCHYLVGKKEYALFDACFTLQVPHLLTRLAQFGIPAESIKRVVVSHMHADRIAAIPYLKKQIPELKFVASSRHETTLKDADFLRAVFDKDKELLEKAQMSAKPKALSFSSFKAGMQPDEFIHEGDSINIAGGEIARVLGFPGHTTSSLAFLLHPSRLLLVDETCGYFNLNGLHASGGDADINLAASSIKKLSNLEINGLCLPATGVVTGNLCNRFVEAVLRNTSDMLQESKAALADGVTLEEIQKSVYQAFYHQVGDFVSDLNRLQSFTAIWNQISEKLKK